MFTGIIRDIGTVSDIERSKGELTLRISSPMHDGLHEGDSVAVNGACLTALEVTKNGWLVRLMDETLKKTNLGDLQNGSRVNLERPLRGNDTLDGHFVMGHVDGVGKVTSILAQGDDRIFTVETPSQLMPYIISKGSITLDGVSLTVVEKKDTSFTVSLMPYTLLHTIFGEVAEGYRVNIEVDVIGKYVESFLAKRFTTS